MHAYSTLQGMVQNASQKAQATVSCSMFEKIFSSMKSQLHCVSKQSKPKIWQFQAYTSSQGMGFVHDPIRETLTLTPLFLVCI